MAPMIPQRARRLFGDRRSAAAQAAGQGARIVFWTIVNYEVWDIGKPMARQLLPAPTGVPLMPDVVHWAFHEYGMRVGCWRFHELFKKLKIKPTLAANARICEDYPRVAEQARATTAGNSWATPTSRARSTRRPTRPAMIHRTMEIMQKFTGKRPVGWLGPGLTQTLETPDLLAAAGVKYIGDWVYDDEPTVIRTTNGPLVTLPYTIELNDIPMMLIQHHESDYLLKRTIDQFDRLYAESAKRAKIRARSRSTPTSAASRTGSNISRRSTNTSTSTRACCTGTARRFSTGTAPEWHRRANNIRPQNEFPQTRRRHAAERPPRLFTDRQAQAAEAAERRAHGGLDRHQCRGMGPDADHAAHGLDAAGRRFADARHSELVLARIRQPGRLLAAVAGVRRFQDSRRHEHQRRRRRGLSRYRQGLRRA